jgi:hypothetical protein
MDTLTILWTTFSTVGYGLLGRNFGRKCLPISFITALEAFVGVLYASIAGAIIMGKIMRYNAVANVFGVPPC